MEANEHTRFLEEAEKKIREREENTKKRYTEALLSGSNALEASRMLDSLEKALGSGNRKGPNGLQLSQLVDYRKQLIEAVEDDDKIAIGNINSNICHLTSEHAPDYFVEAEQRNRHFSRHGSAHVPTWIQSPSYRFVSLMKGDADGGEEVTPAEQRSCISRCAWSFAVIGLLIAISFLVVDFWSAQTNPALSTNLFHNEKLKLPTLYGCMTFPMIPSLDGLPNGSYRGYPLWGLRSYTNEETGEIYTFPDTADLITEPAFIGPERVCKEALRYLSKDAIIEGLKSVYDPAKRCYSCLRIGSKKSIVLSHEKALTRPAGAVTLEFATSRDFEFCFSPLEANNPNIREDMKTMLKDQGEALVRKGIVTIVNTGDFNVDIQFALDFGFEEYSKLTPGDNRQRRAAESSLYCNLYLFSGHFFPVKPGTETRYVYEIGGGVNSWRAVGDPSNFLTVNPAENELKFGVVNRTTILNSMRRDRTMSSFGAVDNGVHIYALSGTTRAQPAFNDFAAALRSNHRDVLLFAKKIDGGVQRYTANLQHGGQKLFRAAGRFRRYNISLDFATFEVEEVTRRPTTTVAEFFTDIFEYMGLFTGVCAYSILVGPARMYLKRSNR